MFINKNKLIYKIIYKIILCFYIIMQIDVYYNKRDKINKILEIIKKLKTFPATNGGTIDLYRDHYIFYDTFKKITNKWINEHYSSFKGSIPFEELGTHFEYIFPSKKDDEVLFVLRKKNYSN